jgi:hypothetical protein
MSTGIRAEVRVDAPPNCPIARMSAESGLSSNTISKSVASADSETVTEEFMVDGEHDLPDEEGLEKVFTYGGKQVYRFDRERGTGCPCERIEQFDCPVVDVHTRDGGLYLTFHATDMDELQSVVGTLRDAYDDVDVLRLLHSAGERSGDNLVFVDRGELTDRQREVLETAHRMGYFDHPKGANATEVADVLDISRSTFTEHLAAAQRKLLDAILEA